MNRTELIDAVSNRSGVSSRDVDATLKGLFEVVAGVVAQGDEKISLPGFISFEQVDRAARTGRNPQTGESIDVPAAKAVKISAGSKLKAIAAGREQAP
ncbi:MAG: HU family DNA-binding protein [Actinomycetota bacterium]|nr:HU family DNA-binding protein [Actinomycetota bacterium]MDP8953619.1 HU family DNA-binding protein [Actinomycetota bacterium]